MAKAPDFAFADTGTFNDNLQVFSACLRQLDAPLAAPLSAALVALTDDAQNKVKPSLLTSLLTALTPLPEATQDKPPADGTDGTPAGGAPPPQFRPCSAPTFRSS